MMAAVWALIAGGALAAPAGSITVQVLGLKNSDGQVLVSVFNAEHAAGYPGKREQASAFLKAPVKDAGAKVEFKGLPAGTYAVAVIHDENSNDKLDTNFIGIPREGVGASNNPKPRMGPPLFEDTRFEFDGKSLQLEIKMQ